MKTILNATFFLLCFCNQAIAQDLSNKKRVILKLKYDLPNASDVLLLEKRIGNAEIDGIILQHKVKTFTKKTLSRKANVSIYRLEFMDEANIDDVVHALNKIDITEFAEQDYVGQCSGVLGAVPNDAFYNRQWSLKNNGSFTLSPATIGADIDMEGGWDLEQGDSSIIVAIIDSGNKLDHPEFSGRIWINYADIPGNGMDDDNNGFIDDRKGWDFSNADNDPTDDYGHGTNVTGIIGANGNNNIGYAGVDWNCKLMNLKAINSSNFGFYSWWADAIYYAVDNGAKVINMSLGGSGASILLDSAVNYALSQNVTVVVSMMNFNSSVPYYPAAIPGVIAVGATNPNDRRTSPFFWSATSGSSYGSHISVSAPGNFIYGLQYQSNTNYNSYWGGTSQAAPHVSGLAALLLARITNGTPALIKLIIESTAEDQIGLPTEDIPGWDQYHGHGRINAANAIALTLNINNQKIDFRNIVVYPNPSSNQFTIKFPNNTKQIEIFDAVGKSVQIKQVKTSTSQNFELKAAGTYFIQIKTENELIYKKIIITQ